MAVVLKGLERDAGKYPWKEWTNGKAWSAQQGDDFSCSVIGFRSAVYMHAYRHNLLVTVAAKKGGRVDFQFSKPAKSKRTK